MPGCELLVTCPYYNDSMYGMAEIDKERYCKGDYCWCVRYLAAKARERNMPTPNPYPEILVGEISGVEVPDDRHRIWDEGYEAGQHDLIAQIGRAKMMKEFPRLFERVKKRSQ